MVAQSRSVRIIRTVIETIRPQFNIELWDGTRIGNFDGAALVINDRRSFDNFSSSQITIP